MKNYEIIADSEAEEQAIRKKIANLNLEDRIEIRHAPQEGSCPLEVHYRISNGDDMAKKEDYSDGGLIIDINDSRPQIQADDVKWTWITYDPAGHIASLKLDHTLVMLYFG